MSDTPKFISPADQLASRRKQAAERNHDVLRSISRRRVPGTQLPPPPSLLVGSTGVVTPAAQPAAVYQFRTRNNQEDMQMSGTNNNTKKMLSKNFSESELACPCGCGTTPQPQLVQKLQDLRDLVAVPLRVNSAARCVEHNKKVGGVPASEHVAGLAADIHAVGTTRWDILVYATQLGFCGVGVGENYIHLDLRPRASRAVWIYRK